jgi:hypothetical protein
MRNTREGLKVSVATSTTELEDVTIANRYHNMAHINHISTAVHATLNNPDAVHPHTLQAAIHAVLKAEDGSRKVVVEPTTNREYDAIEDMIIKTGYTKAMEKELASHAKYGTWSLVPVASLPPGLRPIGSKWVWKIKVGPTGEIEKYKARLTARGDQQKEGIDYNETYAATVKCVTLKLALIYAAKSDSELFTIDYVTAFLNAFVKERIYMEQPPMFHELPKNGSTKWGERLVCRLNRALYGIKQAPREWNQTVDAMMQKIGFKPLVADQCLYQKKSKTNKLIMASLYVDDTMIVVYRDDLAEWEELKENISSIFPIEDIGECRWILRMAITRDRERRLLWLSQEQSIHELVTTHQALIDQHYGNKRVTNPAGTELLDKDGGETEEGQRLLDEKELKTFQSLVGSNIYIGTCTRPDIAFQTNRLAMFMSAGRVQHLLAAVRVVAYLRDTATRPLCFFTTDDEMRKTNLNPLPVHITVYCDSDFASCVSTRRSTTGCLLLFNGVPFHWVSRRQKTVALSSTEAEWMAICDACKEALWTLSIIEQTSEIVPSSMVATTPPITARVDNSAALTIVNGDATHTKMKHVAIRFHFVRDLINEGKVRTEWVSTLQQMADILTKRLPTKEFEAYVNQILSVDTSSIPLPMQCSSINGTNTPTVAASPNAVALVANLYADMKGRWSEDHSKPLPVKAMGCV